MPHLRVHHRPDGGRDIDLDTPGLRFRATIDEDDQVTVHEARVRPLCSDYPEECAPCAGKTTPAEE